MRVELGSIAEFINGAAFKPEDWGESGRRIIRIQNLTDQSKPYNRTTREVAEKLLVHPGDLLVSWSATLGVFEWTGPDIALLNQHIFRVVPDEKRIEKRYLRHGLGVALHEMRCHLHGATMQHVNRGEFLSTKLYVPPLPEQRRIAQVLDQAEALRAKRRSALAQLATLTQSIFLDMFGNPASNPRGWPRVVLDDVLAMIRSGANPEQRTEPDGWPITRIETISEGVVNPKRVRWIVPDASLLPDFQLRPGDILFSHINSVEHIGKTAIYVGDPATLIHGINLLRLQPQPDLVDSVWLLHLLKHNVVRTYFRTRCKRAVNQASLNQQDIKCLAMFRPPLSLQREFAFRVTALGKLEESHHTSFAELDALFASLQHRAFRGEL